MGCQLVVWTTSPNPASSTREGPRLARLNARLPIGFRIGDQHEQVLVGKQIRTQLPQAVIDLESLKL